MSPVAGAASLVPIGPQRAGNPRRADRSALVLAELLSVTPRLRQSWRRAVCPAALASRVL